MSDSGETPDPPSKDQESTRPPTPPSGGAWIFLSHSHQDVNEVRLIRNALESKGHYPVMFFLKCLNDDSEVDSLVKREIEAREWFLLCDSANARMSKWVQAEVEYIKSLPEKAYETVDLESDWKSQLEAVQAISKRVTVFLSYSRESQQIAREIAAALRLYGYRVFPEANALGHGDDWSKVIEAQIQDAAREGFVVPLLTRDSVRVGSILRDELVFAMTHRLAGSGNIIPLMMEDCAPPLVISRFDWLDWRTGSFEDNLRRLVHVMKNRKME